MSRLMDNFLRPTFGFMFATLVAFTVIPLYVFAAMAAVQVAVCPLIYIGRDSPPTNPEALAKWNPHGFTDCVSESFGSATGVIQKIWK